MKRLVRTVRDTSEGCVYNVFYDTRTGKYSQSREGREDESQEISEDSWHVAGY